MQKTTLQFSTLAELVQFQKAIDMFSYRINASALSLTGQISENNISLGLERYNAKVLLSEPALQELEYECK
jgi:hypothetical protein